MHVEHSQVGTIRKAVELTVLVPYHVLGQACPNVLHVDVGALDDVVEAPRLAERAKLDGVPLTPGTEVMRRVGGKRCAKRGVAFARTRRRRIDVKLDVGMLCAELADQFGGNAVCFLELEVGMRSKQDVYGLFFRRRGFCLRRFRLLFLSHGCCGHSAAGSQPENGKRSSCACQDMAA